MKNVFYVLLLMGLLVSCSEENGNERIPPNEDPGGIPNDTALSLAADVEGIALNANEFSLSRIMINEIEVVRITAQNSTTNELLEIQFPDDAVNGAYAFSNSPTAGDLVYGRYVQQNELDNTVFISESGLLNLMLQDGKIKGNTVFTLSNASGGVIEVTFCEFTL